MYISTYSYFQRLLCLWLHLSTIINLVSFQNVFSYYFIPYYNNIFAAISSTLQIKTKNLVYRIFSTLINIALFSASQYLELLIFLAKRIYYLPIFKL